MFVDVPDSLASFRGELSYEYSQEASSDLLFEVQFNGENEFFEVKKLYNAKEATINIAPILANRYLPRPKMEGAIFDEADYGCVSVVMRCGDELSDERLFVASRVELPESGLVSIIPQGRFISYAENDEVWLRVGSGVGIMTAVVEVTDDAGVISYNYSTNCQGATLVRFRFDTKAYSSYAKMAKVKFVCSEEVVCEVNYYYVSRPKMSVRLAWIGRTGAVEYYTFPVINSLLKYRDGSRVVEVESAYESEALIDALSDMIISPRVWLVRGDDVVEVEMMSDRLELNPRGELSTVKYKIAIYD